MSRQYNWLDQLAARLEALPPAPSRGETSRAVTRLPAPRGLPDNPVAAQRLGWAYVGGAFPTPEPEPPDISSVLRASPSLQAALRADPSLARQLGVALGDQAELIEVVPMTQYTFDGRADAVETVPLRAGIPAVAFASAVLVVRLHAASWSSDTTSAAVRVFNMSRPEDEPATLFLETTARAEASIPNGTAAPALFVAEFAPPIAAQLRVELRWSQGRQTSTQPETLTLGVDLVGRPTA